MKKYMLFIIVLVFASLACGVETNVKKTMPTATVFFTQTIPVDTYATPEVSSGDSVLTVCIDGTNCK